MERARRSPEPIIRMVAHGRTDARLLADLHLRARDACGAARSVLLEYDAPGRRFFATSGLDGPDHEAWLVLPASLTLAFELLASGHPRQVAPLATVLPDLALQLGSPTAILAPVVAAGRPIGLLVLAMHAVIPALEWMDQVSACADGFALALDRGRLERDAARQHAVDVLLADWAALPPAGDATEGLDAVCSGIARTFAADRVTFWAHDRVGQRLTVVSSSDGSHLRRPASSPTDETGALLVHALRTSVPAVVPVTTDGPRGPSVNLALPLRGQRRGLGVIVLHGMTTVPGDDAAVRVCLERMAAAIARIIDARQLLADTLGTYRDRAALRERLSESEALSHLIGGIAHELNNPLQAVLGNLELVRRKGHIPAALAPPLRRVSSEAGRAARVVRNLLIMAGAGHLPTRRVSVGRALNGALGLRAAARKRLGISVIRQMPATWPAVAADSVLLRQVFLNLLQNAEHALAETAEPRIEIAAAEQDGRIEVTIRDNGPGLPGTEAGRVFAPFFTTRESGVGLGLTLVQRVVQEFGGRVTATNHPEGGAVFTVSFPVLSVVD